LVVINLGGAASSLYGFGYGQHELEPSRVVPFFPAFLAGMNLVVVANDAFSFLLSWELMSLTSWALVLAHHKEQENRRAALIYLLMASFGTLALLFAFGVLSGAQGDYDFETIRATPHGGPMGTLVLALALVGAGSKAGLVPLHVWLPLAHPAAPSHISALMSGVMTKVAIYAVIRIVFDLVGSPEWWWSLVLLIVGGVSSVMGVLYALLQQDLKRLLAYSTVENVGLVFAGLGLALAFSANGVTGAAALAFTAALLHVINHTVFKSLLFFGAGAVLASTGLRDIGKLGGLIHRLPQTSFVCLVGSAAISALPPFNGFASEWMTFQAVLLSPETAQWGLKLAIPAVGALLALSAALAGACFIRFFGLTFLGRARGPEAEAAREVDVFSLAAMYALAALALLLGIFPGFAIDGLQPVAQAMVGDAMPRQIDDAWLSIVPIDQGRSSYNGLLVFVFICLSAALTILAIHALASLKVRRSDPWDCGYPDLSPNTQYSASSFAQPIRRVFATLVFQAHETVKMPPPGAISPASHKVEIRDLIWDALFAPIGVVIFFAAERLNRLQFLTIRRYLGLVFYALISLLLILALWP
jgi:formate hydrogenlyase subunit 3/multisubunit Na+/H+ antiporter MnhD subunit